MAEKSIHENLMPLYLLGGAGVIFGVFYLINKNVDKLTRKLDNNKTVEILTDPIGTVTNATEKASYEVGWSFWDWYDRRFTEPALKEAQAKVAQQKEEAEYAARYKERDSDSFLFSPGSLGTIESSPFDPATFALGLPVKSDNSLTF